MGNIDIQQFRDDVHTVLAKLSRMAPDKIQGSHRLSEDLNLDSLKRMEALSRVCDKYELDPDIEKVMELKTVDDVIRLMEEHVQGR